MSSSGLMVEPVVLARDALLDELETLQSEQCALDARRLVVLAEIDRLDEREHPAMRWNREAVSSMLRCAPVTAAGRLAQARTVCDLLPDTLAALEAGRITGGHVAVLLDVTLLCDAEVTGRVEARVLPRCDHLSVAEFKARCRKALVAVDPEGAERRHAIARKARRVRFVADPDGMGSLFAHLGADELARVRYELDALTEAAVAAAADDPDDARTRDEIRADVLIDLLTAGADPHNPTTPGESEPSPEPTPEPAPEPARRAGRRRPAKKPRPIQVIVPLRAAETGDPTAEPGGVGEIDGEPVPVSVAIRLASDPTAWWRPVLINRHGRLEALGARTYKPGAMLKRLIELTDRTCRFPGCRRRAEACDCDHLDPFDHTDPTAGGLTETGNLHCLCRRHHRLKHDAGWITTRHNGTTHWLSSDSRYYASHPEPWLDPLPPKESQSVGDPNPPPF